MPESNIQRTYKGASTLIHSTTHTYPTARKTFPGFSLIPRTRRAAAQSVSSKVIANAFATKKGAECGPPPRKRSPSECRKADTANEVCSWTCEESQVPRWIRSVRTAKRFQ